MILTSAKLDELMTTSIEMLEDIGYKVPDYSWKLTDTKNVFGVCHYGSGTIDISRQVAKFHDEDKVLDTCIHELCHALAPRAGHKGLWKVITSRVNRKYGMSLQRCYSASEEQKAIGSNGNKYVVTCDGCGGTSAYKKRTKRLVEMKNHTNNCYCTICKSKSFTVVGM